MNGAVFLECGLLRAGTGSAEDACEYCGASDPAFCQFVVWSGTVVTEKKTRCCSRCKNEIEERTPDNAELRSYVPKDRWKKLADLALSVVEGACVGSGAVALRMFTTGDITIPVLISVLAASGTALCVAVVIGRKLMLFDLRDAYAKRQADNLSEPEFIDCTLRAMSIWVGSTFGAAMLGRLFAILGPMTIPAAFGLGAVGGLLGGLLGRKLGSQVGSMIASQIYLSTVPRDALKVGDHILLDGCHSVVVEVQQKKHNIVVYKETKRPHRELSKKQIALDETCVSRVSYGREGGLGSGALREAKEWVGPDGRYRDHYRRTYDSFFHFVRVCRRFENKHPEN